MCVEFDYEKLDFSQQVEFPVYYREKLIDEFIPDLIVNKKVIIEVKTVDSITDEHRGQLLNYLKISGIKVGLIINFKPSKLEWEQLVLETARN